MRSWFFLNHLSVIIRMILQNYHHYYKTTKYFHVEIIFSYMNIQK